MSLFNRTFWPALILRTISSLALAAIFVAVIVNLRRDYTREERQRIINLGAYFMAPLGLMVFVAPWYFAELPERAREQVQGGAAAMMLFFMFGMAASALIGAYAYFGLIRAKRYINLETSLLLLGMAFVATGSMEFVREGIRKPYVIYGMLYSNGIPTYGGWPARLQREGILAHAPFIRAPGQGAVELRKLPRPELGELVFRANCRMCHEIDGFNALRDILARREREPIAMTTLHLDSYRYMPPFIGNREELKALIEFQTRLAQGEAYRPASDAELDDLLTRLAAREPVPVGSTGAAEGGSR
jgi:mono/diheme cytochrome c family protein